MENSTMTYLTFTVTTQEELLGFTDFNDFTDFPENEEHDSTLEFTFRKFSMIIYSVAFLLGTIGNGLVIFFTVFKMKRTVNVVWFLNLAIADFMFTFFLPLSITHVALRFHWPFGRFMCKLNSTILFINLYASIFQLSVISIDRCTSVMFPVWCQNHRTPRLASFVALGVWILAFSFSLPYFIFRETEAYDGQVTCYNSFHEDLDVNRSIHKGMVTMRFIVGFVIPFTLIVLCYAIIMSRIHRNRMNTSSKPFKIIVAVVTSFFVCWFPYHVFSFLESSVHSHNNMSYVRSIGIPLTTSLAFINSCVNPIIYVFIGRDFKTKLRRSFKTVLERAFMEETVLTSFKSKTKSISDSQQV